MGAILKPLWDWFAAQFMPYLWNLFKEWFGWFGGILNVVLKIIKGWQLLIVMWVVLTSWAGNHIVAKFAALHLHDIAGPSVVMLQYFAFMNRFLPLSEAFSGAVLIFDIWLIVVSIRWIKSFIPTISN